MRTNHKYRNLNPFEVLQLPYVPFPEETAAQKRFRRLSVKVHPDKNTDHPHAEAAFDYVNKAWRMFSDEDQRGMCERVVEAAKQEVEHGIKEKKAKAKREGAEAAAAEADDAAYFEGEMKKVSSKLFAQIEMERQRLEKKDAEERKRKREYELDLRAKRQKKEEFEEKWAETREKRVNGWRAFAGAKGGKKARILKPPKLKTEKKE
eukprot:TRINITY_DN5385_c0_g1_i1.p1 TRINITY_DN5385_c0_g1~~TRINITY_DN5385_c0_g1_i1.p1  ORF type:complete len:206 (-),score=122.78 TRINITY_DN5385_c0_g1_i1:695-1312(-)